jgi:hypothetical protein
MRKRHQHQKKKRQIFKTATQLTEEQIQQAGMLAREQEKPKKERGLYPKYAIRRLDGSTNKGGKHNQCDYFVLDITHDPHAAPAIFSYARSAEADGYKDLAKDLYGKIQPFLKKLEDSAVSQLAEDMPVDEELQKMSNAELASLVSTTVWADLSAGDVGSLALEELLARFDKLASKPKRTKKKDEVVEGMKDFTDKVKAASKKVRKNENTDTSTS